MMAMIGISVCGLIFILSVKNTRPEMGLLLSIAVGLAVIFMGIPYVKEVLFGMEKIAQKVSFGGGLLEPLFKTVGICFLSQIASELCRDAGERALGMKVELVGKAMICAITVPMMSSLLDMIISIVP